MMQAGQLLEQLRVSGLLKQVKVKICAKGPN